MLIFLLFPLVFLLKKDITPEELEIFFHELIEGESLLEEYGISALSVSVLSPEKRLYQKSYGYENFEKKIDVSDSTVFGLASVSKLFVGLASLQVFSTNLQAEVVDVVDDDILHDYIIGDYESSNGEPKIRKSSRGITLMNLLTHTGGFDEGLLSNGKSIFSYSLKEDLKERMPPRIRQPNIVSTYSNYGMALMAYAVERKTGIEYSKYIQRNIFSRLNFTSTYFGYELALKESDHVCEQSYLSGKDEYVSFPINLQMINAKPSGSVYSSTIDLEQFALALLRNDTNALSISPEEFAFLFTPQFQYTNSFPSYMDLVFYNYPVEDINWHLHEGDLSPFHSCLMIQPEFNISIIVLMSSLSANLRNVIRERFTYQFLFEEDPPQHCSQKGGVWKPKKDSTTTANLTSSGSSCMKNYSLSSFWPRKMKKEEEGKCDFDYYNHEFYPFEEGCFIMWRYQHTTWLKYLLMFYYIMGGNSFCVHLEKNDCYLHYGHTSTLLLENIFDPQNVSTTTAAAAAEATVKESHKYSKDYLMATRIAGNEDLVEVSLSTNGFSPNAVYHYDGLKSRRYWVLGSVHGVFEYFGSSFMILWILFQGLFMSIAGSISFWMVSLCGCACFCTPRLCISFFSFKKIFTRRRRRNSIYQQLDDDANDSNDELKDRFASSSSSSESSSTSDSSSSSSSDNQTPLKNEEKKNEKKENEKEISVKEEEIVILVENEKISSSSSSNLKNKEKEHDHYHHHHKKDNENSYVIQLKGLKYQLLEHKKLLRWFNFFCFSLFFISFIGLICSSFFNSVHFFSIYAFISPIYSSTGKVYTHLLSFCVYILPIASILSLIVSFFCFCLFYLLFFLTIFLIMNWKDFRWLTLIQIFIFPFIMLFSLILNISYFLTIRDYNTFVYK